MEEYDIDKPFIDEWDISNDEKEAIEAFEATPSKSTKV